MTFYAQRNNIKMMFGLVAWVMILLHLFATRTLKSVRPNHFTIADSIIHGMQCFDFFRMSNTIASQRSFTLLRLSVSLVNGFIFLGLSEFAKVFLTTDFAFFALSVAFIGSF